MPEAEIMKITFEILTALDIGDYKFRINNKQKKSHNNYSQVNELEEFIVLKHIRKVYLSIQKLEFY